MTDTNTVTLTGRLVRKPQLYPNGNGKGLALFTIACNRNFKDRDGKTQTETAFVPCKTFGAWASGLTGRQKGDLILVSGRLKTESWEKEGTVHRQLILVCQTVHVITLAPKVGVPSSDKTDDGSDDEGDPVPF